MKIKDLATMAGNCRQMRLINTKDPDGNIIRQHLDLGGKAVYPLDGMQPITPETLMTIADVDKDVRDKYTVDQVQMTSWLANYTDDLRPDDVALTVGPLRLKTKREELMVLNAEKGGATVFLHAAMIKPIKDVPGLNFALRRIENGGAGYEVVVAFEGFANIGTFAPNTRWAEADEAVELHNMWVTAARLANENAMRDEE